MPKKISTAEKISGFLSRHSGRLRNKILLSMIGLILLFALIAGIATRTILLRALKAEFQRKGISLARNIAANSVVDLLTQNASRLKKLAENEKNLDTDAAYVFIIDSSGRLLAHTFPKGFPVDLINVNTLSPGRDFNIQLLDTQRGFIYDIVVPILLDGSLIGRVHLGILRSAIQKTIRLIDSVIAFVTLIIMVISILLAGRISRLIADEEELTKFREREKIALDLHDNCAQDLANLIKRLELCEKLFKIEPLKALEELNALKENIRSHLFKARQVIHGLKSPEEEGFSLLEKINEYIRDYQRHNDISIKLDVSGPVNKNIPADKATHIFYIITEALTNIKKHAQAKNVELCLNYNGINELALKIKDDGIGFDSKQAGLSASASGKWGLTGMRKRAASLGGTLAINSIPKQGTEVLVRIPFSGIIYNI